MTGRCNAITFSVGLQRIFPGKLLDPDGPCQARAAGIVLGRLHRALAEYPRSDAIARTTSITSMSSGWPPDDIDEPTLASAISAADHLAAGVAADGVATQLINTDFRAANILWHDERISAVLDLEETRPGRRVEDVAWSAVHLGTGYHHWRPISSAARAEFLAGYGQEVVLGKVERGWLRLLILRGSIQSAARALGSPNEQPWLASVRSMLPGEGARGADPVT